MKKLTRILCAAVIILMILQILASCSKTDGETDSGSPTESSENKETTTELDALQARQAVSDDLPKITFGGESFRVMIHGGATQKMEIVAEEEIGEAINDAVYKRNRDVEERFDVKIEPIIMGSGSTDVVDKVRTNVAAGIDFCDLIASHAVRTPATVSEGLYIDWYSLDYVNFEKPWWSQSAVGALTVGGHAYLVLGDFNLSALHSTYCIFFNKNVAQDNGLTDLYQTVFNGEWTIEKLSEISKSTYKDLNGNGEVDEEDQFGFLTSTNSPATAFMWSSNHPIASTKDEAGYPVMNLDTDKLAGIVNKVYELYYGNPGTYLPSTSTLDLFKKGNSLFSVGGIGSAVSLRDVEFEYGIIPYPKYDEAQDNYYTLVDGSHTLLGIPTTASRLEMTAVMTEALNAYTYKDVIPKYYEVSLKVKYTRDEESVQILDLITEGRIFDFGYFYDDWKGFAFMLQDLMQAKNNNFASYYEKRIDAANAQFEKIITAYKKLEEQ